MEVRRARKDELPDCLLVRQAVFIEEQAVPESIEIDGLDEQAVHFIAREGEMVVGTARLRAIAGQTKGKAERVAVLSRFRGRGIGGRLMDVLEAEARELGLERVILHAQISALEFYLARGYIEEGPRFDEAGIVHQEMWLQIPSPCV